MEQKEWTEKEQRIILDGNNTFKMQYCISSIVIPEGGLKQLLKNSQTTNKWFTVKPQNNTLSYTLIKPFLRFISQKLRKLVPKIPSIIPYHALLP